MKMVNNEEYRLREVVLFFCFYFLVFLTWQKLEQV